MFDADKWTDKELARLEKRLAKQYAQAGKELDARAKEYFKDYAERYKREELVYLTSRLTKDEIYERWKTVFGSGNFETWYKNNQGLYTKSQFNQWAMAQMGRGKHWEDLRDQMAQRLTETNVIAQNYINDILPKIYTTNNNAVMSIAKQSAMEKGVTGINFELVDEHTVRRLMMSSSEVRPYKPVKISLDVDAQYNKNKLQNALLQGILQGDSIDHIADRFQTVTGMNRASAIKNARTAVTGAQSAGKQDRYEELAEQGCVFTKIWVATADNRTRPEHDEADGQEVDWDEYFDVGGEELLHPADPNGSPWNIVNCRCTMKTGKIKFKSMLTEKERKRANIKVR